MALNGDVGAPLENNHISIFDDENKEIKDGKIGNIFIKSTLFEGYYNNKNLLMSL